MLQIAMETDKTENETAMKIFWFLWTLCFCRFYMNISPRYSEYKTLKTFLERWVLNLISHRLFNRKKSMPRNASESNKKRSYFDRQIKLMRRKENYKNSVCVSQKICFLGEKKSEGKMLEAIKSRLNLHLIYNWSVFWFNYRTTWRWGEERQRKKINQRKNGFRWESLTRERSDTIAGQASLIEDSEDNSTLWNWLHKEELKNRKTLRVSLGRFCFGVENEIQLHIQGTLKSMNFQFIQSLAHPAKIQESSSSVPHGT